MNEELLKERLRRCLKTFRGQEIRIMEVCGTHTCAISKSGIRSLLPKEVRLLSGPGCPVCVTPESYIDLAVEISGHKDVIIVTFGDMMKVKGSVFSLADSKARGAQIIIVYSPEEALAIAAGYSDRLIVFLAVGFETTAPLIAALVKRAYEEGLSNLLFLTALKLIKPAIRYILQDGRNKISAIICPGHVASITGADHFSFITDEYGIPSAVCGFDDLDIAACIILLLEQLCEKRDREFVNLYKRCVSAAGNMTAQSMIHEVFDTADTDWRGIGTIKASALVLNEKYAQLDAAKRLGLKQEKHCGSASCSCTDILLGLKLPYECRYFGSVCMPEHPLGSCMVSSEGACATHYRYGEHGAYCSL